MRQPVHAAPVPSMPQPMSAQPAPARGGGSTIAVVLVGLLLLAGIGVGGWLVARSNAPAAVAERGDDDADEDDDTTETENKSNKSKRKKDTEEPAPAPKSDPGPTTMPPGQLTPAEIEKRLKADGWDIHSKIEDLRINGPEAQSQVKIHAVLHQFQVRKGLTIGTIKLFKHDDPAGAAAHFSAVDGKLPADQRLGRDGRLILSVRFIGNRDTTVAVITMLTQ